MSTTRFHLPDVGFTVSPVSADADASGFWNTTRPTNPARLSPTTRTGTALGTRSQVAGTGTPPKRQGDWRFVTPPLDYAGPITGQVRVALMARQGSNAQASLAWLVAVVTPQGTARGYLVPPREGPLLAVSSPVVGVVDVATFAGVEFHPGDRLQLEVGASFGATGSSTSTWGRAITYGDPDTGGVYVTGTGDTNTAAVPYWDVTVEAGPGAPTDLVASSTPYTATVSWTPDPAATGYEVSIGGGPYVAVGDVWSHTWDHLTPATAYTVAVRAYNAQGPGPAATVVVTTQAADAPGSGYYRARVQLGGQVWTAAQGDAAELGPILPLELGWEVPDTGPGLPAQPSPDTATVSLVTAAAVPHLAIGTPARVTVWLDPDPEARPYATMAGEVGDLEVFPQQLPDGAPGVLTRMLLVGHEVAPNAYTVGGSGPWPAESGQARAERIMAEAGQFPFTATTPVGNHFAERAPSEVPKADQLTDTLTQAAIYPRGRYSPPARHLWRAVADAAGNLQRFVAELVTAETTELDVLDGRWLNRAASWRRTRRRDGSWVAITSPAGTRVYGDRQGPPLPPVTVQTTDTAAFSELLLSSTFTPAWVSGEWFRIHLDAGAPPTYGLDWFRRDPDSAGFPWATRLVVVDNIQVMPGLFARYGGMLAGARLVIERGGRVVVLFRLRPDVPAWSTVTPRWIDEPPAATWADEPPTATWAELRTTPREDA